jgi:hypothetical protein
MKVWKVTVGPNYDNWLQLAETINSAAAKAEARFNKQDSDYRRREITSIVLVGEAEN